MSKYIKITIIFLCVLTTICISCLVLKNNNFSNKNDNEKEETKVILGKYVISTEDINLYIKNDDDYLENGKVGKDVVLKLDENIDKYYKVIGLDKDYYVLADSLENTNEVTYDTRYKNYIVFNYNIVANEKISFYTEDDKLVYSLNGEFNLPIIINDAERYGVEFAGRLLYVKKSDIDIIENHNTDLINTNGIGVLNYHFFYDDSIDEERNDCNQVICASKTQFKTHLDYIKDNNFFTPTMKELEMYIDGKIQLPKSVVITIDDGWRVQLGIDMLDEYQLNATLFVVTSWYDPKSFKSDYVEIHSHSDNMHNQGVCPTGQGGAIQCLPKEEIINDLKISSEKIGGTTVFCYPFYEYNEHSIEALKEAGFTLAFKGESSHSDNLVKVGSNKYALPRFVVVNYTTMSDFTNYLG